MQEVDLARGGGMYITPKFTPILRTGAHFSLAITTTRRRRLHYPSKSLQPIIRCQVANETPSIYRSRISTHIPLFETPAASFDEYLEDKPRVFRAMFPDSKRSQQLNKEEWRVHMLPIQFLFLTVMPVVDMRLQCRTNGKEYPPGVPSDISKVLQLDIIRWELQGLDNVVKPAHFSLGVKGLLYPDRRGVRSFLKGRLEMTMSIVLPPMLVLIPEDARRSVSESLLNRLVENMKQKVNDSLLADYSKFRQERQMNGFRPRRTTN